MNLGRYSTALGIVMCLSLTSQIHANDDLKLSAGDPAPNFMAMTTAEKEITLDSFKDADVVLVVFTCNSCPVAVAYEDRLIEFANQYKDKGVALVAINNHRSEDVDAMKKRAEEKGFNFVYAYEGTGKSAKDYGAKVTPHCFVLDRDRKLVYQGAFDDSQNEPTEHYVSAAVDATLAGSKVEVTHHQAFGCSIKFRSAEK